MTELKVPEGRQGQQIDNGPNSYTFEPGEWVEVDDETFQNHKDRDVFEARSNEDDVVAEYDCEECDESFESKQGLSNHMRTHEDEN